MSSSASLSAAKVKRVIRAMPLRLLCECLASPDGRLLQAGALEPARVTRLLLAELRRRNRLRDLKF